MKVLCAALLLAGVHCNAARARVQQVPCGPELLLIPMSVATSSDMCGGGDHSITARSQARNHVNNAHNTAHCFNHAVFVRNV